MARRKLARVGTARARRGEWTTGELVLGHYPDAPITAPVNILCGADDGPTLWVQGAIHGAEIGGSMGVLRLFSKINPARMKGTIVAVMAANPMAFRAQVRNTPFDGENMNRLFPGNPIGAHSQQAAAILMETAWEAAHAMMDLHSGGMEAVVPFYAIHWEDGSDASREARRLARSTGTPDNWACTDDWLHGAMFTNFTRRGKPGLIIECGGGGPLPDEHVDNFAQAVRGVAQAMKILPGRPPRQERYRTIGHAELVFNARGGFFLPDTEPGAVVRKGQRIGRVMDAHGTIIEELRSPNGPAYIAAIGRRYLPLNSGTMIAETLDVVEDR